MVSRQLEELYKQLSHLRRSGTKMKDIADHIGLPASVVSALYSTVLPAFINNAAKMGEKDALDYAFSLVNNVSRKKIVSSISTISKQLNTLKSDPPPQMKDGFTDTLNSFITKAGNIAGDHLGLYDSYSLSSACNALKVEPFLLSSGEAGEIRATRKNAYDSINNGIAIFPNEHSMCIMLNELDESQLALVTIFLQLPFYEKVKFLRGIYIALDYNRNPIARRIVFVKRDPQGPIDIESVEGKLILKENLDPELEDFYDYVSGTSDIIKTCSIPFPKFDREDLISEKQILSMINANR